MDNKVFSEWDNANKNLEKVLDAAFVYPVFSKQEDHIAINLFFIDKRKINFSNIPLKYQKEIQKIIVAVTHEIIQRVGLSLIAMVYKDRKMNQDIKDMMARDAISRFNKYDEDHDLKDMMARKLREKLGLPVNEDEKYKINLAWEEDEYARN